MEIFFSFSFFYFFILLPKVFDFLYLKNIFHDVLLGWVEFVPHLLGKKTTKWNEHSMMMNSIWNKNVQINLYTRNAFPLFIVNISDIGFLVDSNHHKSLVKKILQTEMPMHL